MGENLYVSRDYTFDKINDGTKSQTFTTIAQKSATLLLCRICFTHRLLLTSLQTVNIFQFSEKTCLAHISMVVSGNSVASEPISSTKLMYVCLCVFFWLRFRKRNKTFSKLISISMMLTLTICLGIRITYGACRCIRVQCICKSHANWWFFANTVHSRSDPIFKQKQNFRNKKFASSIE